MSLHTYYIKNLFKHRDIEDEIAIKYINIREEKIRCHPSFLHLLIEHYLQVFRHRKTICLAFHILSDVFNNMDKTILLHRLLKHDLSKLSAEEALGYAIKFHTTKGPNNEKEVKHWEDALDHHYKNNDHHPEFYAGKNMDKYPLIESVIDMIACHIEKDLKPEEITVKGISDGKFSVHEILDINPCYLNRYSTEDRVKVENYLSSWRSILSSN